MSDVDTLRARLADQQAVIDAAVAWDQARTPRRVASWVFYGDPTKIRLAAEQLTNAVARLTDKSTG